MSKRNIGYIKQDDPPFVRQFKEKVGYKEGPSVDTKREQLQRPGSDEEDNFEDEKPTVVVLKAGDLTAEEAERLQLQNSDSLKEDEVPSDGRVIFKKPVKRSGDESSSQNATSIKKKRDGDGDDNSKVDIKKKKNDAKKIKNASLLSFAEDDEDEDG